MKDARIATYERCLGTDFTKFPPCMLCGQICVGGFYLYGMGKMRYKKWKTWSKANQAVHARVYLPVSHKEIQCFARKWQIVSKVK